MNRLKRELVLSSVTDTSRPLRLPEVVADRVQAELFAKGLLAGDTLPTEVQLAEQYAVSRTVVREAARILEQRGLVDIRPGRGMVVTKLDGAPLARHYALMFKASPAAFDHLMDVRLLVEVHATGLAAEHRSDSDLKAMQASLDHVAQHSNDYRLCLAEDLRFHSLVGRACGNPIMSYFLDPVNECLKETYRVSSGYMARLESTLSEHQTILNAIAAADVEKARLAATRHLERIKNYTEGLLPGLKEVSTI